MAYGGYSEAAAALTSYFGRHYNRQQIELWHRRRTLNKLRERFPDPVWEDPDPKPRQPRVMFDFGEVIRWAEPGIPAPHGDGWRDPHDS